MMLIASQDATAGDAFLKAYSGELMILVLFVLVVIALIILVPQLLRAHLRKVEMLHTEHLKALEQGLAVPPMDEKARAAGRRRHAGADDGRHQRRHGHLFFDSLPRQLCLCGGHVGLGGRRRRQPRCHHRRGSPAGPVGSTTIRP